MLFNLFKIPAHHHFRTFIIAAILIPAGHLLAVNGKAISVAYRYCPDGGTICPENNWGNWYYRGSITKFTINGSSYTCDTIYNDTNGLAQYPAMNFQGTKVAFYRWNVALNKTKTATINKGTKSYIAVVNMDGTGLQNLCELPASPAFDGGLDWPAADNGQWIYYTSVKTGFDGDRNFRASDTIRRVNINSGVSELVCKLNDGRNPMPQTNGTWPYVRRFSLNLEATRASIQIVNWPSNINSVFSWPIPNGNITGLSIGGAGSCNTSLSATGGYVGGYSDGGHGLVDLRSNAGFKGPDLTNWSTQIQEQYYPSRAKIQQYATTNKTINGTLINGNGELIRWAVNSDKWVCQQLGWYGHADGIKFGTNQVIYNWVDNEVIIPTANQKQPNTTGWGDNGVLYTSNCPGDFWVDGGSTGVGKCEGADGTWRTVNTNATATFQKSLNSSHLGTFRITRQGTLVHCELPNTSRWTLSIIDMKGSIVLSQTTISSQAVLPTGHLAAGSYTLRVRSSQTEMNRRFTLAK